MKQNLTIILLILVIGITYFNELAAREPIGTIDVYRAKKDLVIHGVKFKKGEIVACGGCVCKINEMGFSFALSFIKKKQYYLIEHWSHDADPVRIPLTSIIKDKLKEHQLLLSDIGNSATFVNKNGNKLRIFKCKTNGHNFNGFGSPITLKRQEFYMLCLDDEESNLFSQLKIKEDHFILDEIVPNGGYINPFESTFDNNGNMLCDLDIVDGTFEGDYYGGPRPVECLAIAYLHDTKELFLDGEFYKMTEKDGRPVEDMGTTPITSVSDKQQTTSTVQNNSTNKLSINKKKKTGYLKFRNEPQYMIINVDIDWPVANNGKSITELQKSIIESTFERNTTNIDAIIKEYCTKRSDGKVVTTIPKKVKQHKVPWFQNDLEVKCTQVVGRYATFQIDDNTFNGYHGLPTYRRYVNYDIKNNKIILLTDIINDTRSRNFQELLTSYLKAHQFFTDLSNYKDGNVLRIAGFALREKVVVFNFEDEMEGYLDIEVPKEMLAQFLTEYGRQLLLVTISSNYLDKTANQDMKDGRSAKEIYKDHKQTGKDAIQDVKDAKDLVKDKGKELLEKGKEKGKDLLNKD